LRVFIDTNIPMYAAGRAHPAKQPSVSLLHRIADGELDAATDVEVLQEILHRFSVIDRREDGFRTFDLFSRVIPVIYPIEVRDLLEARALMAEYRSIQARDAIHLAVMQRYQIEVIYTFDRHFDGIPAVDRVEP
jgi:predicted nucleic acid-binding protein